MARPRSNLRRRVLHAARQRFLMDGVDGASLRRIAAEAKTNIGMVYYYFPTKDELFLGVVEEVYEGMLRDFLAALEPSLPVETRLRGLYRRIGAVSEDEMLVIRLVLREALVSSSRLGRIVELFENGHLPLLITLVLDGFRSGTFDSALNPVVVFLSMMALAGPAQLLRRTVETRSPFAAAPSGPELSDLLMRSLLSGVGPKSALP